MNCGVFTHEVQGESDEYFPLTLQSVDQIEHQEQLDPSSHSE